MMYSCVSDLHEDFSFVPYHVCLDFFLIPEKRNHLVMIVYCCLETFVMESIFPLLRTHLPDEDIPSYHGLVVHTCVANQQNGARRIGDVGRTLGVVRPNP